VIVAITTFATVTLTTAQQSNNEAFKISFPASYGCDTIMLHLDEAADRIHEEPNSSVFVIAHPAKISLPGTVLHHLNFIDKYLNSKLGRSFGRPISTGLGPVADELTLDVLVVPTGVAPPKMESFAEHFGPISGKYDSGNAQAFYVDGKWGLGAEICALENVYIDGLAEAVANLPGSRAFVVVRPGTASIYSSTSGRIQAIRNEFLESGKLRRNQVIIIEGSSRGSVGVELWLLRRGAKRPIH